MDFRDGQEASNAMATDMIEAATTAMGTASAGVAAPMAEKSAAADSKSIRPQPYPVEVDHSRDALLTDFGKER